MTTWLFEPASESREAEDLLDITMRFEGDVTVCVVDGPLCLYTAPVLDGWLEQLHANGRDRVIVDASGIVTLSSHGVEVLASHAARLRADGGVLQVRSPSRTARRVLSLCSASHLVEGAAED